MGKPLNQIVEDYYKNGDWPLPAPTSPEQLDAAIAGFMGDPSDCRWSRDEVRAAIMLFWENESVATGA
jgi:hypothetical protein